jgi:hypothetical protein
MPTICLRRAKVYVILRSASMTSGGHRPLLLPGHNGWVRDPSTSQDAWPASTGEDPRCRGHVVARVAPACTELVARRGRPLWDGRQGLSHGAAFRNGTRRPDTRIDERHCATHNCKDTNTSIARSPVGGRSSHGPADPGQWYVPRLFGACADSHRFSCLPVGPSSASLARRPAGHDPTKGQSVCRDATPEFTTR